jgi:hypothetical protein
MRKFSSLFIGVLVLGLSSFASQVVEEEVGRLVVVKRTFTVNLDDCVKTLKLQAYASSCRVVLMTSRNIERIYDARFQTVKIEDRSVNISASATGYTVLHFSKGWASKEQTIADIAIAMQKVPTIAAYIETPR